MKQLISDFIMDAELGINSEKNALLECWGCWGARTVFLYEFGASNRTPTYIRTQSSRQIFIRTKM